MLKASGNSLPELVNDEEEICALGNVRCMVKNTVHCTVWAVWLFPLSLPEVCVWILNMS